MTDTPSSTPPNTPWWSQPGATAVLPQEPPVEPPLPPAAETPAKKKKRGGTALLLALALLVGGGAGGAVAAALDNGGSSATLGSTTLSDTRVVGSSSDTVKGTPESAASVISPSIVTVEVSGQATNQFGGTSSLSDTGSGIIIRDTGYILTNNHVVAAAVGGGSVHVTLNDGKTVAATIVGTDPSIDLAVIKVDGVSGLTGATFADSENLKVGQAVLAVGAPLGLANTVTQGIVSTLHRPVRTGEAGASAQAVIDAVQTDAAINPGNSGGALVDLAGRVVGINSAIATTGGGAGQSGNIGVGFAIPSNVAVKVSDQLIKTGKAVHSQMGVGVDDAPNSTDGAPGLGATIKGVTSGGPAARGGVQVGDVVTKVDDRRVTDANSLIVAIRSHDPGSTVTLTVTRGGATKTLKVTLASVSS
jgi:putative serine protease PepD